jgi:hypothetical protein
LAAGAFDFWAASGSGSLATLDRVCLAGAALAAGFLDGFLAGAAAGFLAFVAAVFLAFVVAGLRAADDALGVFLADVDFVFVVTLFPRVVLVVLGDLATREADVPPLVRRDVVLAGFFLALAGCLEADRLGAEPLDFEDARFLGPAEAMERPAPFVLGLLVAGAVAAATARHCSDSSGIRIRG